MNVFPNILAKYKLKFQKTETEFCRWKSTDNNDINYLPVTGKSLYLFTCERKNLKTDF